MPSRKKSNKTTIDPKSIKTRDLLMVRVINGITKAGVQKDQKKEASKKACRKPIPDHTGE